MLAVFRFGENEHELAVRAPRVGSFRQIGPPPFLEARDVVVEELNLVVTTTCAALEAVEGDAVGRPFEDRVALDATG